MQPAWRERAAHDAALIYGVLTTWQIHYDMHPSDTRQPWDPLGGWWTDLRKALLADRDFFAWADAHIIQPIEHFDPMAEAAPEDVGEICERLGRLIARLKDGGGGSDLVWEELRIDRNLTKRDVFVPNHDDLGPDPIKRRGRVAQDHAALKQWISVRQFMVPKKVNRLLAEIIAKELEQHKPKGVFQVGWSAIERVMRGCTVNWSGKATRLLAKVSWPQLSQELTKRGKRKHR